MLRRAFGPLLPLLLLVSSAPVAFASGDSWVEVTSPHFLVLTDAGEKQGRHIAAQLEQMRSVYTVAVPAGVRKQSITILALRNRKEFQALEPTAYLAKNSLDLAGYFMQNVDGNHILLRLDAEGEHPFATVYHEYTHSILSTNNDWLPLWLNEGLAQFFQNTTLQSKDVLLGQPSANDILYLRQQQLLPIRTLLTVDASSPYYHEEQKGSVFYAQSWALTHMLMITDHEQQTSRLQKYAAALAKHEPPLEAAQEAFGDLNALGRSLQAYVNSGNYKEFVLKLAVAENESSYAARPVSTAHADAMRAEILADNGRNAEAKVLAEASLAQAPDDPLTHEAMGFLDLHTGDRQGALRCFRDAVARNSSDARANFFFAETSLELGKTEDAAAIEASLNKALAIDPSDGRAYDALARLYLSLPERRSEAHMMNVKAIVADPGNVYFRLNAASVLQNQGQYASALQVLRAAQHITRNSADVAMIQGRIDELESYEAERKKLEAAAQASPGSEQPATSSQVTSAGPVKAVSLIGDKTVAERAPEGETSYPAEEPSGPTHSVRGTVAGVTCSYPKVIALQLATTGGGTQSFYRSDLFKVDFSGSLAQPDKFDPCSALRNQRVTLSYSSSKAPGIAGQIVSIRLEP